jgi:hypothetical protein
MRFVAPLFPSEDLLMMQVDGVEVEKPIQFVRLAADGRGFTGELTTVGGFVRFVNTTTTMFNEIPWFILQGPEDYAFLKKYMGSMLEECKEIEEEGIQVGDARVKVKFLLCSDWKMEAILEGVAEAKERYFCLYCLTDKQKMRKQAGALIGVHCTCPRALSHRQSCMFFDELRTREKCEQLLQAGKDCEGKGLSKAEKDDRVLGQVREPIWPGEISTDTIFNDVLHWYINIMRGAVNGLLNKCPTPKRIEMMRFFSTAGVRLFWAKKDKEGPPQSEKPNKFNGGEHVKILGRLDVVGAHICAGFSFLQAQRAIKLWGLIERMSYSVSCMPTEEGYLKPMEYKFLAEMMVAEMVHVYGKEFVACYAHTTVDHIPSQLEFLQKHGINLAQLSCETVELRNKVRRMRLEERESREREREREEEGRRRRKQRRA